MTTPVTREGKKGRSMKRIGKGIENENEMEMEMEMEMEIKCELFQSC